MNGITEKQAQDKCQSLDQDTLVVQCEAALKITLVSETIISACMEDIKVTGTHMNIS